MMQGLHVADLLGALLTAMAFDAAQLALQALERARAVEVARVAAPLARDLALRHVMAALLAPGTSKIAKKYLHQKT